MTHPTTEQLMTATDDVIVHLETCSRCRASIEVDVDLEAAWRRVVAGMATQPMTATPGSDSRPTGWMAGAAAAVAVVALLVPVGMLVFSGDAPVADEPGVVEPAVRAPDLPPEPVGDEALLPVPPDTPAYEMSFTVGDDIVGRLIWARPDYFEAVRVSIDPDTGPYFDYKLYRADDNTGYNDPDNSTLEWTFPDGTTVQTSLDTVESTPYVPDPEIPWDLLVPGDLAGALTALGLTAADSADPTHPQAASAWSDGTNRIEATDDGIPVLVRRDQGPVFSVDSLERRVLYRGEVGNNVDIPVDYALYKADLTTPEQRDVLADGIVTLADYRTAAGRAAECAGVEAVFNDETKLFDLPESASDCAATWMTDIESVWRLDAQLVNQDEQTAMYYEARGMPEVVEMYRAERGPERPLASGDGWAIAIGERGPGYCTRTSVIAQGADEDPRSMHGDGCLTPSQMHIPSVLSLDGGWTYSDDGIDRGTLLGIVHQDAVQIEVTFSSGTTETIVPGGVVEFGFRGFGYMYDASQLGVPIRFDIYGMSGSTPTYETSLCDPDGEFGLPDEVRAEVCG